MTDNEKIVIEKREKAYERVVNSLLNLVIISPIYILLGFKI